MKYIVFRTDASSLIGAGHLMRCLTFAKLLRKNNFEVFFICREYEGDLCNYVESQDFRVSKLPLHNKFYTDKSWQEDAKQTIEAINAFGIKPEWLIVDHYALDINWENEIRNSVNNIMVIDDLADRSHNCDLLLDQNYYINMDTRYDDLVPEHCIKFLGPQYLLLRNEFELALSTQKKRTGSIKRILMSFGGSDSTHETLKAITALVKIKRKNIKFDIVVGGSNTDSERIKQLCTSMPNVYYHYHIDNMAELMARADLAVIAAGSTTWEASYLSLPVITIMTAKNQFEAISSLGKQGIVWNLGWHYDVSSDDIANVIEKAVKSPQRLVKMGENAKRLLGNTSSFNKIIGATKLTSDLCISELNTSNFEKE